ncbi:MAG: Holliday junction branch migration protein RuvA [Candidatus Marinimicrobia bacterium]|jgi:Holliday junction DNA helicase RuvA|nr:Holliday junction branch migration protein RuvA [Candidatus Neomarinimicrobiota bacterium]MDP7465077.1 Holliday junction branch migration protein RuvA [Candidatus Neomarinimicrobiota bacterium]|tara:strand:- start:160 stop:750 length:591 start_codon:yes stop_codon:yes gene_type:complete
MIVSIRGKLTRKMPEEIIIETGGLGYVCFISNNTYDNLPKPGEEVSLLTYFHVTENNQQLFAFSEVTERELFMMLIGVSGIGPKTAIVLLSAVSPDEFKRRLIASEVGMLTALPGIGPKTARRIIVELKDKFVKLSKDELPKEELDVTPQVSDAYDALLALGFQMKDIKNAISKASNQSEKLNAEELIKEALAELR